MQQWAHIPDDLEARKLPQLEDKVLHVHPQRPRIAQRNNQHDAAKVLKALGGAGVLEVIDNDADGTYRAVYIVRFPEAVFALHVFQKKSKHSIETPQADMAIIRQRLKVAAIVAQELKDGKARG